MRMGRKPPDAAHGAEKSRVAEASEADCYACRKAGREPVLSELPSGGFVCGLCHPNPHELATPAKFEDEEHSHEPVCEDEPHPRYKPGIYEARCVAAVVYRDPRFRRYVARFETPVGAGWSHRVRVPEFRERGEAGGEARFRVSTGLDHCQR